MYLSELDHTQYRFPTNIPEVGSVIQIILSSMTSERPHKYIVECSVILREFQDDDGRYSLTVFVPDKENSGLPSYRYIGFSEDRRFRNDKMQWSLYAASGCTSKSEHSSKWIPDDVVGVFVVSRPS